MIKKLSMDKLQIYLGDLTYNTVAISTEAMPLNVGFIGAYCKEKFGDQVEISIFKYIEDIENAIKKSPPDVLALSNYVWSYNLSSEIFKIAKDINGSIVTVWGGPNFPLDFPSQEKFMKKHSEVDVYVPIEGEVRFANTIQRILDSESSEKIQKNIRDKPIEHCVSRNKEGKLQNTFTGYRINNLDKEMPSPYTTELLDKFFDGKLAPILQTTRGCPFHCTFCTDGSDEVNLVNRFGKERVKADINYIAKKVPENTHTLYISDLNFGMIPGDLDTCDAIVEMQKKYNFPTKILSTTGKNNKERIIESIKKLNGTVALSMSVQSMDQEVLENIRRPNISVDKMLALAPTIREYDIRTTSEVILGLPGETYEKHVEGLRQLINAKMDFVVIHNCMLLNGSEMNTPRDRERFGFKTKFRIVPRDFGILSNGKKVCEIEEIVIGSDSLSFDEFLELRLIGFVLWVSNQGIVFDALLRFLRQKNLDIFDLFQNMAKNHHNAPDNVRKIFDSFIKATKDELWDSPEEIKEYIQNDENYNKLVSGEAGFNVIQYHHAWILTDFMDEWVDYTIENAQVLLDKKDSSIKISEEFEDVANFCRGVSHNPLKPNRMKTNPKYQFTFNIVNWLEDKSDKKLESFKMTKESEIIFMYTEEQNKIIQDDIDFNGDTLIGKTKALKAIPFQMLWRRPYGIDLSYPENIRAVERKRWNTI